jgi:Domain of unknown function (DUF1707)
MSQPYSAAPLRIGTAEREAAGRALDAHLQAGRLDAEEYGERYARAMSARTRDDIRPLFADLPAPHPEFADERQRRRQAWYRAPGVPVAALVALGAVAVLMTYFIGWFPVGLLFWFVVLPKLGMRGWGGCGSRRRWSRYDYRDSSHPMSPTH